MYTIQYLQSFWLHTKVDEPILNELCVSVFSVCSQSSKTLVAPTFQLALTEILQQMRKVRSQS